jgi:hypothetical protein
MKRTALALILIEMLLFLAISGMFILMTAANPVAYYEIPTEPDTNPPAVTINSPMENQTVDSQNITLSFTITKPETWIKLSTGEFANGSELYYVLGNITSFYYVMDGVESQSISVKDISTIQSADPQRTLSFSINLTLTEGLHSLYVCVKGETIYRNNSGKITDPLLSNMVHGVSETINFTFAKPPEPESFPTVLVIASIAGIAVGAVGLLVYFRKRRIKSGIRNE